MDEPKPVFEFDIPLYPAESPTVHQVNAEQKAMVLYWMWLADGATFEQRNPAAKSSSMSLAADIASDFTKKMFKLEVTPQSIQDYYGLSQKNANHAGFNWDDTVAAMIKRSRGQLDKSDFRKFLLDYGKIVGLSALLFFLGVTGICLLSSFLTAGSQEPYPSYPARVMMQKVDDQAFMTWRLLLKCWEDFASGKLTCPPDLDPELEVAHNTTQSPLTPT